MAMADNACRSLHPKSHLESRLQLKLDQRRNNGTLRTILPVPTLPPTSEGGVELASIHRRQRTDFSSNDYLGLARCPKQLTMVERSFQSYLNHEINSNDSTTSRQEIVKLGSTGSRLLSGNAALPRSIEANLASLHNRPDALLCNSGYDANLSILSSIPIRGDVVIMDELVHNSLVMGVRMSRVAAGGNNGDVITFRHNDVRDLKAKLLNLSTSMRMRTGLHSSSREEGGQGRRHASVTEQMDVGASSVIIVVESVYSMDGDIAPLAAILKVALDFGASVIVDEAHGLGVYGKSNSRDLILPENQRLHEEENSNGIVPVKDDGIDEKGGGLGVLAALGLEKHSAILAVVYTFGKAAGCHGAVIMASTTVIEYLVNYARPIVYSTSLPPHSLLTIRCAYETMIGKEGEIRREKVFRLVHLFRTRLLGLLSSGCSSRSGDGCNSIGSNPSSTCLLPSPTPIQAVLIPGNKRCMKVADEMRNEGNFDVYAIRSPTVPKGAERIRIILHFHNDVEEVLNLVRFLGAVLKNHTNAMRKSSSLVDQGTQISKL